MELQRSGSFSGVESSTSSLGGKHVDGLPPVSIRRGHHTFRVFCCGENPDALGSLRVSIDDNSLHHSVRHCPLSWRTRASRNHTHNFSEPAGTNKIRANQAPVVKINQVTAGETQKALLEFILIGLDRIVSEHITRKDLHLVHWL